MAVGAQRVFKIAEINSPIMQFFRGYTLVGACDTGSILSPILAERKLLVGAGFKPALTNEERINVLFCQKRSKAGLCHRLLVSVMATVFLYSVFFFATVANALPDLPIAAGDAKGMGYLPEPRESDKKVVLSEENWKNYRNILIEPITNWLEKGLFAGKVFKHLDFSWNFGEQWNEKTRANSGAFFLGKDNSPSVTHGDIFNGGFPFGSVAEINKEKDAKRKAYKILWNSVAAQAIAKDLLYDVQLSFVVSQSLSRQAKGVFYRRYLSSQNFEHLSLQHGNSALPLNGIHKPQDSVSFSSSSSPVSSALSSVGEVSSVGANLTTANSTQFTAEDQDPLLLQEMLQLTVPAAVFGYAQTYWRFHGMSEDLGWLYSPVVGRSRKILSSNRSDPLLGSILSLDDLFVFGTKIQDIKAEVLDAKELLMPFAALSYYLVDWQEGIGASGAILPRKEEGKGEGQNAHQSSAASESSPNLQPVQIPAYTEKIMTVNGYYKRGDSTPTAVVWNYENPQFVNKAPWVPVTAAWVPRSVWILELYPRDPYYATGKEILFVDQESMLPLVKMVYDFSGELQRVIFGAWALASSRDGLNRFPFAAFILAVDPSGNQATTVSTEYVRTFQGKATPMAKHLQRLLDIREHGTSQKQATDKKAKGKDEVVDAQEQEGVNNSEDNESAATD